MNLEHEFVVPVPVDEAWRVLLDVERIAPCMPGATLLSVDGADFTGSVKVKVGPITVTYEGKATFDEVDETARRVVIAAIGKETRGAGTAAATVTASLVDGGGSTTVRVDTDLNVTGRPAQFGRGVMAEVGAKLVGQFAACLADELSGRGGGGGAGGAETELAAPGEPVDPAQVEAAEARAAADDGPDPMLTGPAKKTAAKKAAPAKKTAAAKKAAPAKKTAGPPPAPLSAAPPPPPPPPPRPAAEPIDLLDVAGASIAKRVAPVAAAFVVLLLLLRRRRRHR
jgi:carbon monoxide dehydrogenase subunit G